MQAAAFVTKGNATLAHFELEQTLGDFGGAVPLAHAVRPEILGKGSDIDVDVACGQEGAARGGGFFQIGAGAACGIEVGAAMAAVLNPS